MLAATALTGAQNQLGEAEPARALGQETLQRSLRVLGPDHPITLYLMQAASSSHPMPGGDAATDGPSRPP